MNKIKHIAMRALDRTVIPVVGYVLSEQKSIYSLAKARAVESSLSYANSKMTGALIFKSRKQLWDYAMAKISVTGTNAEFGVWEGESINYFARRLPKIYGFDSFVGLSEDWKGYDRPKGSFSLQGRLPKVLDNVQLIKGWFNDTVPGFLAECPAPFAFAHIDCDTYEATVALLSVIGSHLIQGTVIVFDEYFGYHGWELGEFKAWREYRERTGTEYEYLGFSSQQVAIQITDVRSH